MIGESHSRNLCQTLNWRNDTKTETFRGIMCTHEIYLNTKKMNFSIVYAIRHPKNWDMFFFNKSKWIILTNQNNPFSTRCAKRTTKCTNSQANNNKMVLADTQTHDGIRPPQLSTKNKRNLPSFQPPKRMIFYFFK